MLIHKLPCDARNQLIWFNSNWTTHLSWSWPVTFGSCFARHLENIPQCVNRDGWTCCRLDSHQHEWFISFWVNPSYQKLICKTFRVYSATYYEGGLKMLLSWLHSTENHMICLICHSASCYIENVVQSTQFNLTFLKWRIEQFISFRAWCIPDV